MRGMDEVTMMMRMCVVHRHDHHSRHHQHFFFKSGRHVPICHTLAVSTHDRLLQSLLLHQSLRPSTGAAIKEESVPRRLAEALVRSSAVAAITPATEGHRGSWHMSSSGGP